MTDEVLMYNKKYDTPSPASFSPTAWKLASNQKRIKGLGKVNDTRTTNIDEI